MKMKTDMEIMEKLRREDLVFQKLCEAWETAGYYSVAALGCYDEKSIEKSNKLGMLHSEIYKVVLYMIDEYRKDNPEHGKG